MTRVGIALAAVAFIVVATGQGPLRSAIQIGGDEFFEVNKAFLWANGYAPYRDFWNDQPPLHTAALTVLFKCFGPSIRVARAFALTIGILLVAGLFLLVRKKCGLLAASVAALCLVAAPQVLVLGVSVMLEAPAIGAAIWALWLIYRWVERRNWPWLAASGLVLACALQIKMTAAVVAPALAVEVLLASISRETKISRRQAAINLTLWGASAAAGFLLLALVLGNSYDLLWASHFSKDMAEELTETQGHDFSLAVLTDAPEGLCGGAAGLLLISLRRDWRRLAFPVAMLATATVIHLNHRPWWSYYYLHFAVPLAWLTGYAIAELVQAARSGAAVHRVPLAAFASGLGACGLAALLVLEGGARFARVAAILPRLPRVESSALLARMKEYASSTRWVYTRGDIFPFHARLKVIPEVAVIPAKRIWSGRLSTDEPLATVRKYHPEQIILRTPEIPLEAGIRELAESDYTMVCQEAGFRLYVVNSIFHQRE